VKGIYRYIIHHGRNANHQLPISLLDKMIIILLKFPTEETTFASMIKNNRQLDHSLSGGFGDERYSTYYIDTPTL
jgi:hypothetical protein